MVHKPKMLVDGTNNPVSQFQMIGRQERNSRHSSSRFSINLDGQVVPPVANFHSSKLVKRETG